MLSGRLGDRIAMEEEVIKRACSLAMKAHKSPGKPYLSERIRGSPEIVFAFPGSWSAGDWFSGNAFGETEVDPDLFPSLRSIGNDQVAKANEAFMRRFKAILQHLEIEVGKVVAEGKHKVVFAGHSSGGPIAIFATLWFLDKYLRADSNRTPPPRCVTFGSPLSGDRIFPHALRRENWARYFVHFVMKHDIVPRVMLTPYSSTQHELQLILHFFNPKATPTERESLGRSREALIFFQNVMRNASALASHAACTLMGCTNLLLETVTSFIQLSPYRPFGTYIFCTGNGNLIIVENPDAVLQLLFYCSQLNSDTESAEVGHTCLAVHLVYQNELQESLEMQNVVYLDPVKELPLTSTGVASVELATINTALNDLGLSTRARLCLQAAGDLEKQKLSNKAKIDSNKSEIESRLNSIEEYKTECEVRKIGYYDTFKRQNDVRDFNANVKRLELNGMWDEIVEMLKRYELPDEFEGRKEWIELGTKYRRLVEPLDIANYYRHLKNEDTGPYLKRGRPRRYKFTQRWREHAEKLTFGSSCESCFWAEVEELRTLDKSSFEDVRSEVHQMERRILDWVQKEVIGSDIFLNESTFTKWWKTLPDQHQKESCLAGRFTSI